MDRVRLLMLGMCVATVHGLVLGAASVVRSAAVGRGRTQMLVARSLHATAGQHHEIEHKQHHNTRIRAVSAAALDQVVKRLDGTSLGGTSCLPFSYLSSYRMSLPGSVSSEVYRCAKVMELAYLGYGITRGKPDLAGMPEGQSKDDTRRIAHALLDELHGYQLAFVPGSSSVIAYQCNRFTPVDEADFAGSAGMYTMNSYTLTSFASLAGNHPLCGTVGQRKPFIHIARARQQLKDGEWQRIAMRHAEERIGAAGGPLLLDCDLWSEQSAQALKNAGYVDLLAGMHPQEKEASQAKHSRRLFCKILNNSIGEPMNGTLAYCIEPVSYRWQDEGGAQPEHSMPVASTDLPCIVRAALLYKP